MGTVWRGYDAVPDRDVAVKLDVVTSSAQAKAFTRRSRASARLYAHAIPIEGRNQKSDNVPISADGTVEVLNGHLIGTNRWVPPEQIP
ncbi:hypothetical protein SUDANB5_02187 [Streptomyces sp. SudanB5_2050]